MHKFALLLGFWLPVQAADIVLQLDPAQTEISWTLGDVLHTVHGAFKLKRGMLRFDADTGKASGETHVDHQGEQYIATTHFVIPYVKWGMKNPGNFILKVNDHVEMDIRTVAK